MDPNATPPSGFSIGIPGYTILQELGKGGMATVYLAIQQNFGRKIALKIMSPALNTDPTFSERFLREARIVADLSHPHIVQVYDVGEHDGYHYIAMEYHPGGDLQERIARGLSPDEAIGIVRHVAQALDYAHGKGYIHRDIKPDNVLFREDGSAVLTDFGIAKPTGSQDGRQMTQVGKVVGTPKYMSPEQARGQELDARSDLYALGVVFYEMLSGQVPFDGDDPIAIGIKHIREPVPLLAPPLDVFQDILEMALAKDVADRYQSGRDFIDDLAAVALPDDGNLNASPTSRISRVRTPSAARTLPPQTAVRSGNGLLWGGLAALALLTAGAGGFWFYQQSLPTAASAPVAAVEATPASTAAALTARPSEAAVPEPTVTPQTNPETTSANHTDDSAPATAEAAPESLAATPAAPERDPATAILIDGLLTEARSALEQRQLSRPEGQSALDKFRAVLALEADNTDALDGLRQIAATYVVMAREATGKREFSRAEDYLQQARTLAADIPGLETSAEDLAKARSQAQRKSRAQQQAQAQETAAQEREANKPQELAASFRITGLLKSAEYNLANDQLVEPAGNNAWQKYSEVLKLDSANASARHGQQQVITRLLALIASHANDGNTSGARQWLNQAVQVAPQNADVRKWQARLQP